MLYDEIAVKANIRNQNGKRVFYLGKRNQLTPSARDWLRSQRIEILPEPSAEARNYILPNGSNTQEKPEHMTHLRGNILVPKTDPIIVFRGEMDTLQGEILLAQLVVAPKLQRKLEEILALARNILRWDVMQEPAVMDKLCGLTPQQLRSYSHFPQEHLGHPHFMPSWQDGPEILWLNRVRCAVRRAELAAARAFQQDGKDCIRPDILLVLNRMSSMVYILMVEAKASHQQGG